MIAGSYHRRFHLGLSRASFRSRIKSQGLYLTLFDEGSGMGHKGGDNSMILQLDKQLGWQGKPNEPITYHIQNVANREKM